jgi:DNA-binding LacI/PurR family transcriptional regulator
MLTQYRQPNPTAPRTAYDRQEAFAAVLDDLDGAERLVVEAWIDTIADHLERNGKYLRLRIANPRREAAEVVARMIACGKYDGLLLRTIGTKSPPAAECG